jgi:chaperonin GroEL
MRKETKFSTEAREGLKRGIDELSNAVKVTLGPKGKNVIIRDNFGDISTTQDGVTVAKNIEPVEELENIGANMMKQVATKTDELAHDGTTTSIVLAQAILTEAFQAIENGSNVVDLKEGINIATKAVIEYLNRNAIQIDGDIEKIRQVASISANNDKFIGDIIASAFEKVGMNGVVTIAESKTSETYLDYTQGMSFDRGCESPHFFTDKEKGIVEFQNPLIFISDKKLNDFKSFIPLLESVLQAKRPLLIIADDVDNEFMSNFVMNKVQGNFDIALVKAPGYGERRKEMLLDIAVLTNTFVYSETSTKLEDVTVDELGSCNKIIVDKNNTTIIGGNCDKNKLNSRIAYINNIIKESNSEYDKTKARERLGKLTSGVCIINVGGTTELEAKERNYRVVDALGATKAAIEEGILPGGGIALLNASEIIKSSVINNKDQQKGLLIIHNILKEPIKCILDNAGIETDYVLNNIISNNNSEYGYDAKNMIFGNMIELGVIDPKKVTRIALENAVSIANLILTTECVITNVKVVE